MTLRDYQTSLADRIGSDETLRLGGCAAMAEDSLDIGATINKQLLVIKGIAIVVMTPTVRRIGAAVPGWIPVEIPELTISCVEMPTLNRKRAGAMTALSAAERVAALLDSSKMIFQSITQSTDEATGSLSAAAVFSTTTMLSTTTPTQG